MYDRIIRNARIIDGSNSPWFRGDVAIENGVIVKVGTLRGAGAKEVVDAEDQYLAPGFIDIHSHSDGTILKHPTCESRILQGVTTELAGVCGMSVAPVNPAYRNLFADYMDSYLYKGIPFTWESMHDFLQQVEEAKPSVNFAMTVGHGTVRIATMGLENRKPTESELSQMRKYVAQAMDEGAFGISSGLIYAPGIFSDIDELTEVVSAVSPYGGFHASHVRDEGKALLESLREVIEVCRRNKVPLEVSHFKVEDSRDWRITAPAACAMVERARAEGLDVTADQYPYSASSTNLPSYLPEWSLEGSIDDMVGRLLHPETCLRIKKAIETSLKDQWDRIVISAVETEKNKWMLGKSILQIAAQWEMSPADAMIRIIVEERGLVYIIHHAMCEEDVEQIMTQRFVMIGSDGSALPTGEPCTEHPRCFCTFPRVISEYCRNRKILPLETAINKMTGMSAARIALAGRGFIKEGMQADLVLFDYWNLADLATYENPSQGASGIRQVYVNGVLTAENGQHTGARAGMVLRKGR